MLLRRSHSGFFDRVKPFVVPATGHLNDLLQPYWNVMNFGRSIAGLVAVQVPVSEVAVLSCDRTVNF
jgi:hypothetical protein